MDWDYLNPPDLPDWSSFLSQVVRVEANGVKQVFVAGQVGIDARKRVTGDGGFAAQKERAFENLGTALAGAGGAWADIAMLTIYVVGYDGSQAPAIAQAIRTPVRRRPAAGLRVGGCAGAGRSPVPDRRGGGRSHNGGRAERGGAADPPAGGPLIDSVSRREVAVLIEALFEAVFTTVVEVVKAAWRHDFPDPPRDPARTDGVEVAPQSSPSHPSWDHDVDGQPSSNYAMQQPPLRGPLVDGVSGRRTGGDHLTNDLFRAAAALAGTIGLSSAVRAVRPESTEVDGQHVLSYRRPVKAIVIVFWLWWVGFVGAALFAPTNERIVSAVVVLGFLLLVLSLHLEFFGVRIAFDETGIRARSPWRRKRVIPWSAVTNVWDSPMLRWYVVETTDFGQVRLHDWLSGTDTLLSELERRGVLVVRRPDGWPPLGPYTERPNRVVTRIDRCHRLTLRCSGTASRRAADR
jgi:enamine deaminase RidA (YjgF/YER057c/UK114 family)